MLLAAAVSTFVYVNNGSKTNELLKANVEALANGEGDIPKLPCVQAVSICYYIVTDADGNFYNAETTGFKNVE